MKYASYAAESILLTEHFPRRFVKVEARKTAGEDVAQ